MAAGSLSSKNILRPGKRQPKRVPLGEEGEEDDDDEPEGARRNRFVTEATSDPGLILTYSFMFTFTLT